MRRATALDPILAHAAPVHRAGPSPARGWRHATPFALTVALATPALAFAPADLVSSWAGVARHDGTTSPIGFVFEAGDSGRVLARLSLPAIHLYGYGVGHVQVTRDSVRFGPFALVADDTLGSLRGVAPTAVIPCYDAACDGRFFIAATDGHVYAFDVVPAAAPVGDPGPGPPQNERTP